jgi:dolichyl-phosphate beta-glucosyltransferase
MSLTVESRALDVPTQPLDELSFSVIIPAYREGNDERDQHFKAFLDNIQEVSDKFNPSRNHQILVVDDGSQDKDPADKTISIARAAGLEVYEHDDRKNHGKGAALRLGFDRARGSVRAFADADGAFSAETVIKLIQIVQEGRGEIAVVKRNESSHESFMRRVGHVTMERLCDHFAETPVSDTQAGAKAFSARAAEKIWPSVTTNRYAVDRHALRLAQLYGFDIVELEAIANPVPGSHVHALRDGYRMAVDSFRIGRACKELELSPIVKT